MNKCVSSITLRVCAAAMIVCAYTNAGFAQSVPSPWAARDVGSPSLTGSAAHSSGTFEVDAAGRDIWGSSDQFTFIYQRISGDVEIVARVDGIAHQHRWSKAGVMIRSALTGSAAHGFAVASAGMGVHFQRRTATGAASASTIGSDSAGTPVWVRAVRTGTQVATSWSSDGANWRPMGAASIGLGSSAYVGIAVTSHDAAARTTARVSNVRVTRTGLPSGQRSRDIGAPAVAGSARYASGTYTLTAAGRDIWDTADQFHFVYRSITGDVDLVARVASITNTHAWAKAGVMVRESLTAGARHAMVVSSVGRGYAFQRRPNPGVYSEHTSGGSGAPPGWVRLVRRGDLFQAFRSTNGSTWTPIGSDTIPMNDTVYVGLAVTSHNQAAATTARLDNFRVTASTSPDADPTVALTSPRTGASFTAGATIGLAATASDPEGQLARVEFYAGSTRLGSDTSAPYTFSWSGVRAGTYTLTAVAYDAAGGSATSSPVTVQVGSAPAGAPRLVVFNASATHAAVTSYELRIFSAGANPATATPVATSNLGRPVPGTNGEISVDRSSFFSSLAAGEYQAAVSAINPSGRSQSAAVAFTR